MTELSASPLGHATTYADHYDPTLLFAVERAPLRAKLGLGEPLPFRGADLWTAYELAWLDATGKPAVAIATFAIPAESPCVVESKSLKLYLTAFNFTRFAAAADVASTIARDVGAAAGAPISVALSPVERLATLPAGDLPGECLDALPLVALDDAPRPQRLTASGPAVVRTLCTHLFRSVCPVTGQPDYASVQIRYSGPAIDPGGMLAYLVAYRRQPGFHEDCVERIFADVWRRCAPEALTVYARFTRRGGLDINPWRTSGADAAPENLRTARQ